MRIQQVEMRVWEDILCKLEQFEQGTKVKSTVHIHQRLSNWVPQGMRFVSGNIVNMLFYVSSQNSQYL